MKNINDNKLCNNCNSPNHLFFECDLPRISIGIILYYYLNNDIYLLLIKRKDTIGFIDFIRGQYELQNLNYVRKLLSMMTKEEHFLLLNRSFGFLWNYIWYSDENENQNNTQIRKKYKKEYNLAKNKFYRLSNGILYSNKKKISLSVLIKESSSYSEKEWEFPKGKRYNNESDLECAIREIFEETKLVFQKDYEIYSQDRIVSDFIGQNNKMYRYIFYIAEIINIHSLSDKNYNTFQKQEISDIMLFKADDTLKSKIRPYNYHIIECMNKAICKIKLIKNKKSNII